MKKILALSLLLGASGSCFADVVGITSITNLTIPVGRPPIISTSGIEFNPGVNKIVFKIAGKTCTFNSSGNPWGAGQGKGCTYGITVNNSTNTLSQPISNGNGCTLARDMLAACK